MFYLEQLHSYNFQYISIKIKCTVFQAAGGSGLSQLQLPKLRNFSSRCFYFVLSQLLLIKNTFFPNLHNFILPLALRAIILSLSLQGFHRSTLKYIYISLPSQSIPETIPSYAENITPYSPDTRTSRISLPVTKVKNYKPV